MSDETARTEYNRAKGWQLALFPLNNTATNCIMLLMLYVSYLAVGGIGVTVTFVSLMLTWMRIFDAITDPIIGFVIDKTKTKFGKFRPVIVLGYLIMAISLWLMYFVCVDLRQGVKLPMFILLYFLYIIGYTLQTACTKSGQTCLTNDPEQRPIFTRFDAIYTLLLFSLGQIYVSNYLQPKYGEINVPALQEFAMSFLIISGIFTICAVVALWQKDHEENWGLGKKSQKVHFSDYWSVIKSNRGIQMLVIAASVGKLTMNVASHSSIMVMVFGIVMGNYALSGQISLFTIIPTVIIILLGTRNAQKRGSKNALVVYTWWCVISAVALFLLFWWGNPRNISFSNINFITILFFIIYSVLNGVRSISGNIVIPMIADCADYETYLSGRYIPGMMGTLFSFVDKIVSAFSNTIVGLLLVAIGYSTTLPQPEDQYTSSIFWMSMIMFLGLPVFGWILSLIAMKFYPLDGDKMKEIQKKISEIKNNN